jgi:hypothetical protein
MELVFLIYVRFDFALVLPVLVGIGGVTLLYLTVPVMSNFEKDDILRARRTAITYFALLQITSVLGSLR